MTESTTVRELEDEGPRGMQAVLMPTINAVLAPSEAAAALDRRPILAIWPLIWTVVGLIALSVVNLELSTQIMRVAMVQGMAQQGQNIDADQIRRMVETADTWAPAWALGINLFLVIGISLIAVVIWMASSMAGGKTSFGRSFGVAALGGVIHPLMMSAFVTTMWKLSPPDIRRIEDIAAAVPSLGLALLFEDLSPAMLTLVQRVDLFNLWWVVVIALAGERLLGVKRGAAVTIAVATWALAAIVSAGWASFGSPG